MNKTVYEDVIRLTEKLVKELISKISNSKIDDVIIIDKDLWLLRGKIKEMDKVVKYLFRNNLVTMEELSVDSHKNIYSIIIKTKSLISKIHKEN